MRHKAAALAIAGAIALLWWDAELVRQALAPRPDPFVNLDRH